MSVSVIIAARDAADTIGRAVESALAQAEAAQVIVIDDGSSDGTASAAAKAAAASERLTLRRLTHSKGPAAARNVALSLATQPLVCILDADDFMQQGRLACLSEALGDNEMIADDILRVLEGQEDAAPEPVIGVEADRQVTLADFIDGNISRPEAPRAELGFLKPLFRRDFLERHGLRYDEKVRLGEDFLFYAHALARGARFRLTPACGYVAVEREGSLSHNHSHADLRALLDGADVLRRRPMEVEARQALAAYRAHLVRKLHHREVLAARRAGGLFSALKALTRSPGTAGYVVARTFSEKFGRARAPEQALP